MSKLKQFCSRSLPIANNNSHSTIVRNLYEFGYSLITLRDDYMKDTLNNYYGKISQSMGQFSNSIALDATSKASCNCKMYKYGFELEKLINCDPNFNFIDYSGNIINKKKNIHDYCFGKQIFCYKNQFDKNSHNCSELSKDTILVSSMLEQIGNDIVCEIAETGTIPMLNKQNFVSHKIDYNNYNQENGNFFGNNKVNNLTVYNYQNRTDFDEMFFDTIRTNPIFDVLANYACTTHFDLDLLTLIFINRGDRDENNKAGLEIPLLCSSAKATKNKNIEWTNVENINLNETCVIVLCGALLQILTNNYFNALPHRVKRATTHDRTSIVVKIKGMNDYNRIGSPNMQYSVNNNRMIDFDEFLFDGMTIEQFCEIVGPWYTKNRQVITSSFLEQSELDLMDHMTKYHN